jgi:hypothetical protein
MRPITDEDQVPFVDRNGDDAGRLPATFANLKPDGGEAPEEQVLVITTPDGVTNRVDPILLSTVRLDELNGTFHQPNGDRIIAFTATRNAGKIFLAKRGRGAKAKVGSGFDPVGAHTAKGDKTLEAMRLATVWGNCGQTSANLINGLSDKLARRDGLSRVAVGSRYRTQQEFEGLLKDLGLYVGSGKCYLIDFSFEGIHTFTVEIQPWGVYLPQGYQGAYSAFWWQGLAEEPLILPGQSSSVTQQPVDWETHAGSTISARAEHGLGRLLPASALIGLISAISKMFSLGSYRPPAEEETAVYLPWSSDVGDVARFWNDDAAKLFRTLPFYPGQGFLDLTGVSEDKTRARQKEKEEEKGKTVKTLAPQESEPTPMILIVNVTEVLTPQAAFEALGATGGQVSLCDLLLREVTRQLLANV